MGYHDKGSRQGDAKEMFEAVCETCGNACQVPFKPTTGKGVKCSDCFKKNKPTDRFTGTRKGDFGDRPKPKPSIDYTRQLEAISAKMDKIIRLLEGGTLERPEGTLAERKREERKEVRQTLDPQGLKGAIDQATEE